MLFDRFQRRKKETFTLVSQSGDAKLFSRNANFTQIRQPSKRLTVLNSGMGGEGVVVQPSSPHWRFVIPGHLWGLDTVSAFFSVISCRRQNVAHKCTWKLGTSSLRGESAFCGLTNCSFLQTLCS